ncbi:MAG TPA: hypothetical protein VMJ32_05235 [Pirellulales bacterium]|nr:hypothetical protein [Pirellulales bacterium]
MEFHDFLVPQPQQLGLFHCRAIAQRDPNDFWRMPKQKAALSKINVLANNREIVLFREVPQRFIISGV